MLDQKFYKLSWVKLERDCLELYSQVKDKNIDLIVSISRGGIVVARIFSDLLDNLHISQITITGYEDLKKQKKTVITEEPPTDFKNKTLLIVDEVSDTGAALDVAKKYFQKKSPKKIYTLTPYIKPHTKTIPDFWKQNIDAWIIFPYELRETARAFIKMFGGRKHAKKKLIEVGLERFEIDAII
ncbi:hypothetical protein A3A93_01055 [Candidatus Roizmanbacteria bacterium RIFCSPLOWO2_01_FULL_38_12]|uniref:Phosphoribosyltransferase domain-containing protein n=1 Tax=Candidatus Roizmanbacteria bacterium RIFCSPLOWO2_01_FULL_38_12 TaxID=1802061 RepID=A0A1F7IR99_9BACT|nr:MAG: hypothetical protein A2861_00330 [Candidatus Roizmanbacteria bacterium RIFCSPHIGHO2_01_FULL_38_15]OGK35404.1 MAG: hypothetical protein A3F59_00660 [Candidatus Roizmanbacteria bacterium RIFCSPHIGHO2_12_FULL_38_13]OGK45881.1 MAG: hypothetical protein A3A93_01055 [Candidatus Roizmanbacteria bacterium RIFCSPLOWO2_01_FULL_38_12]